MEKILTIVVPSYNVEKYLPETIPTFLCRDILSEIEILIINDGSKDNTAVVGQQFHEKYPETVFIINKENGGHGSTINKGIELATGKYFKVVDGDDWVDTDVFKKYVQNLKKVDSDVVLTPFKRVNETTKAEELKSFDNIEYNREYVIEDIIYDLNHKYQMHSVTFKTEILKKIPFISERCFYVDQEYIIYPLKYVNTLIAFDYPIYQYRVGNNEQSISLKNMQKNREMHKKVTKNILGFIDVNNFSGNVRAFLENRARGLCTRQFEIYLSMEKSKNTKEELCAFSRYLRKNYHYIYKTIPGKKMQLLRMSNNLLYGFLADCVHKKGKRYE